MAEPEAPATRHGADTLTGKVLDYVGMGFLLVPPEILVLEIGVGGEPVNWPLVIVAFAACYLTGALILALGLRWQKIGPRLPVGLSNSIHWAANNALVWLAMLVIFAFGAPALVVVFSTHRPPSIAADTAADAQKATLVEWLQQAQSERDQLRARMQTLESQQSPAARANPLLEATGRIPSADKERLSNILYGIDQLLDRIVELSESASREVIIIGNETIEPRQISAEQIETHRQKLMSLLASANAYRKDFNSIITDNRYYTSQIVYVLGDRPDDKLLALTGTINNFMDFFNLWVPIANGSARQLITYVRNPFRDEMAKIRVWRQQYDRRLQEMKNSMQTR